MSRQDFVRGIMFLFFAILLFSSILLINSYKCEDKGENKLVKCFDKNDNEIIGAKCIEEKASECEETKILAIVGVVYGGLVFITFSVFSFFSSEI